MKESIEKITEQHLKNYRLALLDTIQENTDFLMQEDLELLLREPPLASMDTLKSKILSNAKEDGVILSAEQLQKVVQQFRNQMISEIPELGAFRKQALQTKMDEFLQSSSLFTKEELIVALQKVREDVKTMFCSKLDDHIQEELIPQLPLLIELNKNNQRENSDSFLQNTSDYVTHCYPSHIEKKIESNMILKDQILLNRLLEHQERYQFTKENSYLFHEKKKK